MFFSPGFDIFFCLLHYACPLSFFFSVVILGIAVTSGDPWLSIVKAGALTCEWKHWLLHVLLAIGWAGGAPAVSLADSPQRHRPTISNDSACQGGIISLLPLVELRPAPNREAQAGQEVWEAHHSAPASA